MALGLALSAVALPLLLHVDAPTLGSVAKTGFTASVRDDAIGLAGAWVASVAPDLDQQNAIASRKLESALRLCAVLAVVVLIVSQHGMRVRGGISLSPVAEGAGVAVLAVAFLLPADIARKLALAALAAGLILAGASKTLPMVGCIGLAAWCVGAALTGHRTFTHSLPGAVLFLLPAAQLVTAMGLPFAWDGLAVGYLAHMAADAVAGGIPLLWPWSKRQGLRLVTTGDWRDRLIGVVAGIGFVLLLVV